jgi:excisionase family DNA binding protein
MERRQSVVDKDRGADDDPRITAVAGGLGHSTTYELVRTGQIRAYRVGRLLRVRREDAEAYLAANQYAPTAPTPQK